MYMIAKAMFRTMYNMLCSSTIPIIQWQLTIFPLFVLFALPCPLINLFLGRLGTSVFHLEVYTKNMIFISMCVCFKLAYIQWYISCNIFNRKHSIKLTDLKYFSFSSAPELRNFNISCCLSHYKLVCIIFHQGTCNVEMSEREFKHTSIWCELLHKIQCTYLHAFVTKYSWD